MLLSLDGMRPLTNWTRVVIDGVEYKAEIPFDLKNNIGILTTGGDFVGKEITFI